MIVEKGKYDAYSIVKDILVFVFGGFIVYGAILLWKKLFGASENDTAQQNTIQAAQTAINNSHQSANIDDATSKALADQIYAAIKHGGLFGLGKASYSTMKPLFDKIHNYRDYNMLKVAYGMRNINVTTVGTDAGDLDENIQGGTDDDTITYYNTLTAAWQRQQNLP